MLFLILHKYLSVLKSLINDCISTSNFHSNFHHDPFFQTVCLHIFHHFPSFPEETAQCALMFFAFLIIFDQPESLLHISFFSPRASGTCSPVAAKGHGMAMYDEAASLVISEFSATKTWVRTVRTALCSKRLMYLLYKIKGY